MKKSHVAVYGVLALAGLAAAYTTWLEGEQTEQRPEEVVAFDCNERELRWLELRTERKTTKIEVRRESGRDKALHWVTVTERPRAEGGESRPEQTEEFVGNQPLDEFLSRNMPLKALRSLGEISQARLTELGLVRPTIRLQIQCGSRRGTFRIGGSTFGSEDRYARAASGGPVYLFPAALVRDLEGADFRFMQRELARMQESEIDEARVTAFGRSKTLIHRNRLSPREAEWVDSADRNRRNEIYGNWLDRVRGLRAQEYLAPGAEPGSATSRPTRVLEIVYRTGGRETGRLELVRLDTTPIEYFARSDVTRSWVEVPRSVATEVEQDVRPVLGLEPLPAPPSTVSDGGAPSGDGGATRVGDAGAPRGDSGTRRPVGEAADAGPVAEDPHGH
ncbi:MAG: hypothetical protein IT379_13285 [Deltaproteobacteria bacterium]|nr:hypothetical protein [Deltaproteobacteria bacterium]